MFKERMILKNKYVYINFLLFLAEIIKATYHFMNTHYRHIKSSVKNLKSLISRNSGKVEEFTKIKLF